MDERVDGGAVAAGAGSAHGESALGYTLHRPLKKPFFGRFMKPWRWPDGVPRGQYERVETSSRNGARIQALLRCTELAAPRGVVLFAHPMGLAAKGFWLKIAEAAAPTLPDFWKHDPLPYLMLQASRRIYPAWERRLRPVYLIGKAQNLSPLLLIHSTADRWTPPEFGDRIERVAKDRGRVERLIVDGAEHTHVFSDARAAYSGKVFEFLDPLKKNRER